MIKAQESIVCYNSRDWLDASPKERLPCKGVPSSISGGTAGAGTSSRSGSGAGAGAGGGGRSGSAIIMCN